MYQSNETIGSSPVIGASQLLSYTSQLSQMYTYVMPGIFRGILVEWELGALVLSLKYSVYCLVTFEPQSKQYCHSKQLIMKAGPN